VELEEDTQVEFTCTYSNYLAKTSKFNSLRAPIVDKVAITPANTFQSANSNAFNHSIFMYFLFINNCLMKLSMSF
jgi:hypothetical protein